MIAKILHRLTTKIQQLGYALAAARFFARFFYVEMVVVAILMGMPAVMQDRAWDAISGRGTGARGDVPARFCPALFAIHR